MLLGTVNLFDILNHIIIIQVSECSFSEQNYNDNLVRL